MPDLDVSQFHFLRPLWLLALLPALYLAWRFIRHRHARSAWERSVDPELLDVLLEQDRSTSNRWLGPAVLCGLVLAVLGLAGPSWERLPQPVEQRSDALVVVLDLSSAMSAEDLAPSRIVRARYKIADVLRSRDEGQTGLVVFAGDAHVVTPMTDDVATIENLLPHLTPDLMPLPGSNPAMGVQLARQLLENAGARQGRILLMTAGVSDIDAVARHGARNFPISVLGVGTRDGGAIPAYPSGANAADAFGRQTARPVAFSRLDSSALQELARRGHGRFTEMTTNDADIEYLLTTGLPLMAETTRLEREYDAWLDRGYLLAALLLPLALLGFRRGALLCLCLVAVVPVDARASTWENLWSTSDRRAHEALELGDAERAAWLFRRPDWRGVALFRNGDFDAAEHAFAGDDSPRGHYNRGNALAFQGRFDDAISAYDHALSLDPDHEDAAFNRDLLKTLLDEQQAGAGDDGPPEFGADGDAERAPDGLSSDAMPGMAAPDDETGDGDPGVDEALAAMLAEIDRTRQDRMDADSEQFQREEEQALQQWLRRVPDDPGGLLRRKFQQETNRRLREGELQRRQEPQW
jgi:Ca-activated chloride channel homolog